MLQMDFTAQMSGKKLDYAHQVETACKERIQPAKQDLQKPLRRVVNGTIGIHYFEHKDTYIHVYIYEEDESIQTARPPVKRTAISLYHIDIFPSKLDTWQRRQQVQNIWFV